MDKQVLIFFPHLLKQRHGGPYSMLFHLQAGLKTLPHKIDFLSTLIDFTPEAGVLAGGQPSFVKALVKTFVPQSFLTKRKVRQWMKEINRPDERIISQIDLSLYPILHFHETIDIWRYRHWLKGFSGKIVLTSHSPRPYHQELLYDAMQLTKKEMGEKHYRELENIDRFAYKKADHLVFPCKEAVESYLTSWPWFQQFVSSGKLAYVTTGVVPSAVQKEGFTVRKDLGIPADAFVISFVGRKIPVKGYDMLVRAAGILLQEREDVYFLVVGTKQEKAAVAHPRFVETGWSDDPFSFVAAADLHVVPNLFTNFDLNVLEVLSLGKPLLLSNTGGNKFFKQFNTGDLFFHEPDVEDLLSQLRNCHDNKLQLRSSGVKNQALYKEHFTAERFARDHIQYYNSLFNGR